MCVTGMGNNMGKEMDNASQRETQKSSCAEKRGLMRKKNEDWRKVKNGGKCIK